MDVAALHLRWLYRVSYASLSPAAQPVLWLLCLHVPCFDGHQRHSVFKMTGLHAYA